tara:strand:- start:425 stop:697 length:273 start_codon:yes stop_codon:yes gene_type:complete
MIWIIVCKDKVGALPRRMAVIEEHRKYLSTNPIKTLVSGPLTDFDGETIMVHSLWLKQMKFQKFINFNKMIHYIMQMFGRILSYHLLIKE